MTALAVLTAGRPPGLSDEESMFLDVVGDVANGELEPRARAVDEDDRMPDDLLDVLWAQELHTVATPEELGGGGGRRLLALLAVERLAEASAAVACRVGEAQAVLAALALEERLPSTGEPPALADAGDAVRCTAAGDALRLDGRVEQAVGLRDGAPLLLLAVGEHGDPMAVVLPGDGAVRARARPRTGLRGLPTASLDLSGLEVPRDAAAGEAAVAAARDHRALAQGAAAIGVGRRAVAEAGGYLQERRQFGRSLSAFGALRRMLADMAGSVAAAAALVHDVATRPSASPETTAQAVRAATTAAVRATDDAVQLHGGYGYVRDHLAERLLRDALSLRALAGGRRQGTTVAGLLDDDPEGAR